MCERVGGSWMDTGLATGQQFRQRLSRPCEQRLTVNIARCDSLPLQQPPGMLPRDGQA
jgi:hypothetical protein